MNDTAAYLQTLGTAADPLFEQAVALIRQEGRVRTQSVQRHLRVGYNRAAQLISAMEGTVVSAPDDKGTRQLLSPALTSEGPGRRRRAP